jgi:branched-chain amino acid transport system ATP-binding protein
MGQARRRRAIRWRCLRRSSLTISLQGPPPDLARALATGPHLLLVDELAAGLNPAELARVATQLRALASSDIALLVVEPPMGFIDQITDHVIVMNVGREIFEGTLADAARDPKVIEVFPGGGDAG